MAVKADRKARRGRLAIVTEVSPFLLIVESESMKDRFLALILAALPLACTSSEGARVNGVVEASEVCQISQRFASKEARARYVRQSMNTITEMLEDDRLHLLVEESGRRLDAYLVSDQCTMRAARQIGLSISSDAVTEYSAVPAAVVTQRLTEQLVPLSHHELQTCIVKFRANRSAFESLVATIPFSGLERAHVYMANDEVYLSSHDDCALVELGFGLIARDEQLRTSARQLCESSSLAACGYPFAH